MDTDLIGKVIGTYRITGVLGHGGMGKVYKARDMKLPRDVALKMIDDRLVNNEEAMSRFRSEAENLGRLQHPNIVTIHDLASSELGIFIVTEFVAGGTLEDVIAKGEQIPLQRTLHIIKQLLDALDHAHKAQVVHRDIKPSNILLTHNDLVKVTDFGIAKFVAADSSTRTGVVMGTPGYMSPEQIRGEKVDHRTDIWSAGIIFYEMLACKRPFHGDTDTSLAYSIVHDRPVPVESLRPEIPQEVRNAVFRSLEKKRENRFQDATDFSGALESGRKGTTRTLRQLITPQTPSRRWAVGTLIVVLLGFILWMMKTEGADKQSDEGSKEVAHDTSIISVPDLRISDAAKDLGPAKSNDQKYNGETEKVNSGERLLVNKRDRSEVRFFVHILESNLGQTVARSSIQDMIKKSLAQDGYFISAEVGVYNLVPRAKFNEAISIGDYSIAKQLPTLADLCILGSIVTKKKSNPYDGIYFCSGEATIQFVEAGSGRILDFVSNRIDEETGETYEVASDRLLARFGPLLIKTLRDRIKSVLNVSLGSERESKQTGGGL